MKAGISCASLLVLGAVLPALAGDERPKATKADYTAISRLIHKAVVVRLPKVFADDSGWGQTIPTPDKLRLPRLKRTYVKVGDHLELPHGTWRKVRVWLEDPARDLEIRVRDLRPINATTYRLTLEADTTLRSETDVQQWIKGLLLLDATARADADVRLSLECDVKVVVEAAKLPPEVRVQPKVADLKVDLKDFNLRKVMLNRAVVALEGEQARQLGEQFKGTLQDLVRQAEPEVQERANEAIGRALREGQGAISAVELLRAVTPAKVKPRPKAEE
jgi:hypothetical protein